MSPKPTSDAKKDIPIRSYGRRRGRGMKASGADALESVLPALSVMLPAGEEGLDPSALFDFAVENVWLEIGFGKGEHLLHQAQENPGIGLIGCEPFVNGVAALCAGIAAQKLGNIRVWPDDARLLMARLRPQSLGRIFLLHPDPWPKTRHHKRRFLQTEILDQMARLLKPGGELRMATDHAALAAWLMEKAYFHPAFEWTARSAADWRMPPADGQQTRPAAGPQTRYGQKGLKQGRPPVYLNFCRKDF